LFISVDVWYNAVHLFVKETWMNWNNVSLVVLGLTAFISAFAVALWISLVIWTFRDMRARTRDAFAQLLASLMVLVLGPLGVVLYLILRPRDTLAEVYERSLEEEALLQDIEERHICPGCKQPIEPDFVLCPVCHTRLRRPCIHCGRLIHPRWGVCPYCGESQRPIPGAQGAGHVTLLDLDLSEPGQTPPVSPSPARAAVHVAAEQKQVEHDLEPAAFDDLASVAWEPMDWELEPSEPEQDLDDLLAEQDRRSGDALDLGSEEPLDAETDESSGEGLFKRG
jgi:RNA polymerase subunit RPABC4/transcription elongation factor Spt4